jgi:hypothetical protein
MKFIILLLFLFVFLEETKAARNHHYEEEEEVPFYVNKIGPYSNPSETYEFYSLPFCQPPQIQHKHTKIGEDLTGDHKANSLYDLRFKVPIPHRPLCKIHLTTQENSKFIHAIKNYYYFEMLYDDLPLKGFIGTVDKEIRDGVEVERFYLFLHFHFHVLYNNDQIIYANITADPKRFIELTKRVNGDNDGTFEFSYSATWEETDYPFKDRMKLYEENFFSRELEIHWLSIMNSCVLVLLLTGFLAIIIMRILRSDYTRYSKAEDEEEDQEDYGWKLIHGDVFRFPPFKQLFTSLLGIGSQCIAMVFSLLILALFGLFYPNNPGTMYTSGIVLYALTSIISGFVSASYFKQMGGEKWAWNLVLVAALFVGPLLLVFAIVNTIAIAYNATAAVPFGTILIIIFILMLVGFPLTIIGGIAGKRSNSTFDAPCRTKNFPREIPSIPWYRSLPMQMMMGGFLPFSAIYIELFYIFSSVWGHSSYQLFGILFIVAIILFIVTACITIALTYFQLSMEDHRWWWNSFLNGGSTGIFVYVYSIFYYFFRSKMSGVLQAAFYFGYMAIVCYFFFIMLGTMGFFSSLVFVRRIYRNIKCD